MYSVELEKNGYKDDSFISMSLEECIEYLKDNGLYDGGEWQIVLLDFDEDGNEVFCYNIITKEDLEEMA